ncbi:MAG: phage protein [Herbinix sp.]|jgi:hypothetical protein|nr:phage protein [Herbinix sp.]
MSQDNENKSNETLESAVLQAITVELQSDLIPNLVKKYLEKGISDVLADLTGYGGDVRKVLKQKLRDTMVPCIEQNDFNVYMVKLDTVLTEIINKTSLIENKEILDNFKDLMAEPDKGSIKLSEIFVEWQKHVAANVNTSGLDANCEDGEPSYELVEVTMSVDIQNRGSGYYKSNYDDATVFFKCEHDPEMDFEFRLYKHKDTKVWKNIGLNEYCNVNGLRHLGDFQIFLMKLNRAFVEIEIDDQEDSAEVEPDAKPEWELN